MTAFPPLRLAVIGVLALSFAVAGCGRKGALDPPPRTAASADQQAQPAQPSADSGVDEYGNPRVPAGPRKRFPLDGLLN